MNRNISSIVFSLSLLVGIIIIMAPPAYAQISDNIVINEVETNPAGNDAASISEWIELYNPTSFAVDLSGWEIASTTGIKKTLVIPSDNILEPGKFMLYSHQRNWFTDSSELVELRNPDGVVIDKTPLLTDIQDGFTSWQRIYDGYDLDNDGDWEFATPSPGSSNGRFVETQQRDKLVVTVESSKPSYLFDEVAVITGSVSQKIFVVQPTYQAEQITILITGQNFEKTVTVYPDLDKNYKTTLNLQKVLGIREGTYDVSVDYAGVVSQTSFTVGTKLITQSLDAQSSQSITTDKTQYIPGETVSIVGTASRIIPFEGMKFTVTDSGGTIIYDGNLFPTNGKFATDIYLTPINPYFGTYTIDAQYSGKSLSTTFEVLKDIKENVPISLQSDKPAYALGDTVKITGRLNQVWVSTMDIEIIQTKQASIGGTSSGNDAGFKILDGISIAGDGSFSYTFAIPVHENRLGDYRISVSKDIGSASHIVHVVDSPEDFVATTDPLTITPDKNIYEPGDTMTIGGFVRDPYENSSYTTSKVVSVSISHKDGTPLKITALPSGLRTGMDDDIFIDYDFTAIPETSGRYLIQVPVTPSVFSAGSYVIHAQYQGNTATASIEVTNPLDLSDGPIITLDKEVYGLGETVSLTGIVPPTGTHTVSITLTRPDGTITRSGTSIDGQKFAWSWTTPISEAYQTLKTDDNRDISKSNFGIYKIKVTIDSANKNLFFKVSEDPANDSISTTPIVVSTEKSLYKAGEKLQVTGNVISRQQGDEGLIVPERVQLTVLDGTFPFKPIHEASVYPVQGGQFSSLFELPATIFSEGTYTVKANYLDTRAETKFSVANDFLYGTDDELSLLLSTDKPKYNPGDTVIITGKPNKLIYLENFDVSVIQQTDNDDDISCGSFICGIHAGPVTSISPSPSGSFAHEFMVPNATSSVGLYEVTVDAGFEVQSIQFQVVPIPPPVSKPSTITEKENRISKEMISIPTVKKTISDVNVAPRVLTGSLITPLQSDQSSVNLKVSTAAGTCIIGPLDSDCLVVESTRQPGEIYKVVTADGTSLKVRYTGPDVRLEKFSILPESSADFLPDEDWNINVLKDDQASRFYYKVTYKSLE